MLRRAQLIPSLAREGGLASTLWAGPEQPSRSVRAGEHPLEGTTRKRVVSLRLGFAGDTFSYAIDLGLPTPSLSAFARDPEIKREVIWTGATYRRASVLVDRRGGLVQGRNAEGEFDVILQDLPSFDTMLTHYADPLRAPEALQLREQMRGWRFYDQLRTDRDAPARRPQVGTHTPVLGDEGADLAAALQTIDEIGDRDALHTAIDDAFPGARVEVTGDGAFEVTLRQQGLLRPSARRSCRTAASASSQVIVVSHAPRLIDALASEPACHLVALERRHGETVVSNIAWQEQPPWKWPGR